MRYNSAIKEEARSLYLQGMGYKSIADKMREQYEVPIVHTTIRAWALKEDWSTDVEKQKKVIRTETNSNATQSVIKHIKTLQAIQSKFLTNLQKEDYEVRPHEMVNAIRLLLQLEHAEEVKEVLVKEVADKLPAAMKEAGLSQKKINQIIKIWINSVEQG